MRGMFLALFLALITSNPAFPADETFVDPDHVSFSFSKDTNEQMHSCSFNTIAIKSMAAMRLRFVVARAGGKLGAGFATSLYYSTLSNGIPSVPHTVLISDVRITSNIFDSSNSAIMIANANNPELLYPAKGDKGAKSLSMSIMRGDYFVAINTSGQTITFVIRQSDIMEDIKDFSASSSAFIKCWEAL